MHRFYALLAILALIIVCGCVRMYSLPDAPPKSEWQSAVQKPQESQEDIIRRFLDVKRVAIQCYASLADGSWDRALSFMTDRTRQFYEDNSDGKGAAAVFEAQTLYTSDGELAFDPVGDVFIRDLVDIRDDFAGRVDEESETRKVLYAVNSSGKARELVFIQEDGKWRLDAPYVKFDLLSE